MVRPGRSHALTLCMDNNPPQQGSSSAGLASAPVPCKIFRDEFELGTSAALCHDVGNVEVASKGNNQQAGNRGSLAGSYSGSFSARFRVAQKLPINFVRRALSPIIRWDDNFLTHLLDYSTKPTNHGS